MSRSFARSFAYSLVLAWLHREIYIYIYVNFLCRASLSHKGVTLLCETYKYIRDATGKSIVERLRNAFEGTRGSLYNSGSPFDDDDYDNDVYYDDDGDGVEKPRQSQRPVSCGPAPLVLFISRPCSPQSITSASFFSREKRI